MPNVDRKFVPSVGHDGTVGNLIVTETDGTVHARPLVNRLVLDEKKIKYTIEKPKPATPPNTATPTETN